MKLALISSGSQALQAVCEQLVRANPSRSIVRHTGGSRDLRSVADREQPDAVILECPPLDTEALGVVALVTSEYPQLAVIVLCAQQTPAFLIQAMQTGVREVLPLSPGLEALEAAVGRVEAKLGFLAELHARPSFEGEKIDTGLDDPRVCPRFLSNDVLKSVRCPNGEPVCDARIPVKHMVQSVSANGGIAPIRQVQVGSQISGTI
ncbi:MAG: DNA-binding response regulator, partial [Betaproteobacteria bacterium]|nr:DNA-binding response regulator [Betaproteobacteria bacterium]